MKLLILLIISNFLFSCSRRVDSSKEDQVILEFAKKLEEEEINYKHTYENKNIPTGPQSNREDK